MKNFKKLLSLILILLFACTPEPQLKNFIGVSGNKLMDGEKEFRFLSFNIPNLNFVEDEMEFTKIHPFDLPSAYEIKDAIKSVKQMGGTAIRAYTIPVRRETDTLDIPRYVLNPGEFDESSFATMDTMLAIANEEGMRLIIPLLNNWKWMGGRPQYAAFRGKEEDEFWSDPQLIEDFKKTIEFVLNRKNSVTGIPYKEDKSILCWETGNELYSTPQWTNEIVGFIKSIDTNHLVMDGFNAIDSVRIPQETIDNPLIDIVTSHHYELNPQYIIKRIEANLERVDNKKPYVIGEFGFLGTPAIEQICDFIIENEIAGGLLWSLRYHRKEGGFYWHSEPLGGGIFKAFHWPGFESGFEYNEKALMQMYREKAYAIRGMETPPIEAPDPPRLLPIKSTAEISWQGSAGASAYDVERKDADGGSWTMIGYNISDADKFYTSLFNDNTVEVEKEYFYRIIAKNIGGKSEPSNEVGPVKAEYLSYIHDMKNLTGMYYFTDDLRLATEDDRRFKEDKHRIEAYDKSEMIYWVPGNIIKVKVNSFSKNDINSLAVSFSGDNVNYVDLPFERESFFLGKGDYNYWFPVQTRVNDLTGEYDYVKLTFTDTTQVGRIEIDYLPFD